MRGESVEGRGATAVDREEIAYPPLSCPWQASKPGWDRGSAPGPDTGGFMPRGRWADDSRRGHQAGADRVSVAIRYVMVHLWFMSEAVTRALALQELRVTSYSTFPP